MTTSTYFAKKTCLGEKGKARQSFCGHAKTRSKALNDIMKYHKHELGLRCWYTRNKKEEGISLSDSLARASPTELHDPLSRMSFADPETQIVSKETHAYVLGFITVNTSRSGQEPLGFQAYTFRRH